MAKAKTSTFTLTEEINMTGSTGSATIPIGSLIDVGDAQALEIESVDYIFMTKITSTGQYLPLGQGLSVSAQSHVAVQLMDKNASALISPADNNLISSAALTHSTSGGLYHSADFYPDDFKNDSGRFVVNDEMYLQVDGSLNYTTGYELAVAVRIKARVVKLATRDWMAISLETVQNE